MNEMNGCDLLQGKGSAKRGGGGGGEVGDSIVFHLRFQTHSVCQCDVT